MMILTVAAMSTKTILLAISKSLYCKIVNVVLP